MRRSDDLRRLRCEEYSECTSNSYRACYCDKQCHFYGDCCPRAPGITQQEYIKLHNGLGLPSRDMFKCGKHDILTKDFYGIYIIADCPDKNMTCFHKNDTQNIENILHVTDYKTSSITTLSALNATVLLDILTGMHRLHCKTFQHAEQSMAIEWI